MNTQVTQLQEVSDHRHLGKLLMRVGIESAVAGLLLGLIAFPSLLRHGSAIGVLWLLMIALVGHGLFVILKPYPKGLIVDCILKCCLGCVLIVASQPQTYVILVRAVIVPWWLIGLAEIAGALGWAARYKRVCHVSGAVSAEWLNYLDRLVSGVRAAAAAQDPSIVELIQRAPLGTEKFKAQLNPDSAIFVGPGGREVLIADRADFMLGPASKSPLKGRVAAELNFANRKLKIIATPDAYRKLADWSQPTAAALAEPTTAAV